jgi:hypothetical protein
VLRRPAGCVLLTAVLFTAACGTPPPTVTFTAAGTSVVAKPAQYCDIKLADCAGDASASVQLAVPAGTPLQVAVPDGVAEAPWHVVFSYRDPTGQQVDARSPLFAQKQHDYTLTLPEPADQLLTAQVQQFGPAPQMDENTGEIEFPVRGSWVLTTPGN